MIEQRLFEQRLIHVVRKRCREEEAHEADENEVRVV